VYKLTNALIEGIVKSMTSFSSAAMNLDFFYRIDGFDLVPGNKTAGFVFLVDTMAMKRLRGVEMARKEWEDLMQRMHERVARSGLVSKKQVKQCGVAFAGLSCCPLMFTTDPTLGGSIGANPEELARLEEAGGEEYIGPSVDFTPHNVDSPAQAMVLLILVQTWCEWAFDKLQLLAFEEERNPKLEPIPSYGDLMTLEEFRASEDNGYLLSSDGDGYYATEKGMSRIRTSEPEPSWATHVMWFNV
jgi:hypothetical protein